MLRSCNIYITNRTMVRLGAILSEAKRTVVRNPYSEELPMSVATQQDISTGTWSIDKVHSHVGFAVKHMVVSNFRGRFEDYDGALTIGENGEPRLEGTVAVDSIVVKDENLAGHLKSPDFFDSANYPQISFRSSAVRVKDGGELEVDGELTIKGHTHNVTA